MQELFGDYSNLAEYANAVGIVGVVFTLTAYYLLNVNKLSSTSMVYLLLNCMGSTLVLFSLMFHWNLSSVITESAWISISLVGVYRVRRARKKLQELPSNIYVLSNAKNKLVHENSSS